jgi:formylglycine-generating enzyme required for sulfatase activity
MRRSIDLAGLCAALLATGCFEAKPARPQLVVIVDTDAHLVGELAARPEVSPDAAVDTLRVDVLGSSDAGASTRTFDVSSKDRWPLSFGVAGEQARNRVKVRLRLFRARDAVRDGAEPTPFPETSVDRLIELEMPEEGIERVRVMLSFDCLGRPVDLEGDGENCVDRDQLNMPLDSGLNRVDSSEPQSSHAGTWPDAIEVPCSGPNDPEKICIPGGFSILGDRYAVGESEMSEESPAPPRPVIVAPFRMDRTEYTVGKFRRLINFTGVPPTSSSMKDPNCAWRSASDTERDAWPLNCVISESAAEVCALEGGLLPTEAQWEHAARGRGEGRLYPWGNETPHVGNGAELKRTRCKTDVQPDDTDASTRCFGMEDVSRDGVRDLAGSMSEAIRDKYAAYADPKGRCWSEPIARDPLCTSDEIGLFARRGGSRAEPLSRALTVLRGFYFSDATRGFRCVYPEPNQ